ncbi:hypothetical protein [Bifidobacterium vansinderenii]|uniref:Uncharacterized protein n=1 Tax=Bifidobacterium vansinderenii TaxID=1984871 RepID=A0A229W0U3_9BIFI|nr:hypothetical protein [Bifidobacterium vansinderenii]OXN01462.1 hypothetical protein Tam10B_0465 [Bifidobacterium vansinderenii]
MSIYTTQDEEISLSSILHDYSHAWSGDPDDIDLRAQRFAQWLAEHDREQMARAWFIGCNAGIRWAQGNADQPLANPYDTDTEESC